MTHILVHLNAHTLIIAGGTCIAGIGWRCDNLCFTAIADEKDGVCFIGLLDHDGQIVLWKECGQILPIIEATQSLQTMK